MVHVLSIRVSSQQLWAILYSHTLKGNGGEGGRGRGGGDKDMKERRGHWIGGARRGGKNGHEGTEKQLGGTNRQSTEQGCSEITRKEP